MTKSFVLFALLGLYSAFTGAAEIAVTGSGSLEEGALKSRPIYLEFDSSPKLSTELRTRFSEAGYNVVPTEAEADVAIKMAAVYSFQRPHARKQQVNFGKAVEATDGALVAQKAADASRAPGLELGPMVGGLTGSVSPSMVLGAGLIDTILSLTGVRSWFNKLVAGDERGFCLGTAEMCKDWKKYDQQLLLGAIVSTKAGEKTILRTETKAKDEELVPEPMFKQNLEELTSRLLPRKAEPTEAASAPQSAASQPDESPRSQGTPTAAEK